MKVVFAEGHMIKQGVLFTAVYWLRFNADDEVVAFGRLGCDSSIDLVI